MNSLRIISYIVLILLIIPILVLLYEGFGPMSTSAGYSYGVFRSIGLTLIASAIAVIILIVLYTPLAYYFARSLGKENRVMQTLSDIPASIPHPIIGIALLLFASTTTPLGKFLLSIDFDLFYTLLGYVVALVIVSAPIYIKAMQPFFESMNKAHEDFALGLGASQFRTFLSVVLPNSGRGVLSASLISMSRAMSEYGSISIIAYEILKPSQFYGLHPISVLIVLFYQEGDLGTAVTASAVMIVVSLVIMIPLRFIQRQPTGSR